LSDNKIQKRVFITWDDHGSRARSLAHHFHAKNIYVQSLPIKSKLLAFFKYIFNTRETWRILRKERPEIVFIVNPPVFAVLVVGIYRIFHRCAFIVDTHCGAFRGRWALFLWLYRFLSKRALINILHNQPLKERVAAWGAPTINLGDIFYRVQTDRIFHFRKRFNVVFVSTYAFDEPLKEVLEAARRLPSLDFYVTGSLARAPKILVQTASENVIFTDYLPDDKFNALLKGSDIVISLTKNDLTMQNGAYEALALGRPLITSSWPVLKRLFYKGTFCVDNNPENLIEAISSIQREHPRYLKEIEELRNEFQSSWEEKYSKLSQVLDHLTSQKNDIRDY